MTTSSQSPHIESLADLIDMSFKENGEHPAYSCFGQTLTFAEIDRKSAAFAAWLQQKTDLKMGDRIVIQLPNITQYPIAVYAVLRAGLIIVNTNPLYTPREMQYQFADSGAKAIITLENTLPNLESIVADTDIEYVIVTAFDDLLTNSTSYSHERYIGFNQALEIGSTLTLQSRPKMDIEDVCVLQYTGGTTGKAKGACLTHKNIMSVKEQILERLGHDFLKQKEEVFICPLPLYHIYAFSVNMISFFLHGCLNVLIPNPRDVNAFVDILAEHQFTGFAGINTLFVGLCQHPKFKSLDFSKLKLTVSGGTTLTSAAADAWLTTTGGSITEGYGLSESSGVISINEPGKEVFGTVGTPTIGTEVQLWDDNNQKVENGQEGQIVVRGPQILGRYWNMPEESADAISPEGFFKTGDVGIRLPNGCIKVIDRLKDMIIVSGFNVYPNEVEDVLVKHPSILEAAVIGMQDEKTGESVNAYLTVNQPIDEAEIITYCRENLTAYKVPKRITVMEELPKSTVGKILRRELRSK